ncbi:Protein GLUTAMINE DUMPER 2, partial [Mucuna pruriens]
MRPMSSSSTSASGIRSLWSPIPYLFGGLLLLLIQISVALRILICSKRKHVYQSSAEGEEGMKEAMPQNIEIDSEPKILVIMAGDHKPTYLDFVHASTFKLHV